MYVYVVDGEGVDVFGSARRALESIPENVWHAYVDMDREKNESIFMEITEENIPKMIRKLNNDHFIRFYEKDGMESIAIVKREVQ